LLLESQLAHGSPPEIRLLPAFKNTTELKTKATEFSFVLVEILRNINNITDLISEMVLNINDTVTFM
jgi:hypothetical protein